MKRSWLVCCLVMMSFMSCNDDKDEILISKEVLNSINEVLDLMEKKSIRRDMIDWTDFRSRVLEKAGSVQHSAQKMTGIREALTLLGDNHSYLVTPSGGYVWGDYTIKCEAENTASHTIPEHIGYVKVPHFHGPIDEMAIDFAQRIQDVIRNSDGPDIVGWIVDLRENGGGNMWPMVTGIGPILGEEIAGYFVDVSNRHNSWRYLDGSSFIDGYSVMGLEAPYELINPNPKVAVLWDGEVASSGEALAVSFIGRENTRTFGTATCGLSTANTGFRLRDRSTLQLATAYMADRNLNLYGGQLIPDEEAHAGNIIQKAVDWIEN